MTKASQWDKLRKVINGVRTGHVMTDEAIIEISFILGVEVGTNNPFELIETPNPDIAPTGGSSDKPELPVNTDEPYKDYELRSAARSGISDEEANRRASAFQAKLSEAIKLDRTDEEFEMGESGGYPVLALGLLQFGRPEKKQTDLTLHDVMDKLHDYDELRLQAKKVFADLIAQVWQHFVNRACGHLSGRHPTADYFRQYVLDWFNLDIRA